MLKNHQDGKSTEDFQENLDHAFKGGKQRESQALFQAASRTLANRWKQMTPKDREPYDDMAKAESERYEAEVMVFEGERLKEMLAYERAKEKEQERLEKEKEAAASPHGSQSRDPQSRANVHHDHGMLAGASSLTDQQRTGAISNVYQLQNVTTSAPSVHFVSLGSPSPRIFYLPQGQAGHFQQHPQGNMNIGGQLSYGSMLHPAMLSGPSMQQPTDAQLLSMLANQQGYGSLLSAGSGGGIAPGTLQQPMGGVAAPPNDPRVAYGHYAGGLGPIGSSTRVLDLTTLGRPGGPNFPEDLSNIGDRLSSSQSTIENSRINEILTNARLQQDLQLGRFSASALPSGSIGFLQNPPQHTAAHAAAAANKNPSLRDERPASLVPVVDAAQYTLDSAQGRQLTMESLLGVRGAPSKAKPSSQQAGETAAKERKRKHSESSQSDGSSGYESTERRAKKGRK